MDDYIGQGFHQIDDQYLSKRPPHISWGADYKKMTDPEKILYLQGLANTMNHAAALLQDERDALNKACEMKEKQLRSMAETVQRNDMVLQAQIEQMNTQRHEFRTVIAQLDEKIRTLQ